VNALSQFELCWNATDLSTEGCDPRNIVRNPLYEGGRPRELVFLGGIIGVPWQAIASSVDSNGRQLANPAMNLRFKSYAEMEEPGDMTWEDILGSPGVAWRAASNGRPEVAGVPAVPPNMLQMIETEFARPGVQPGNEINGREYDTAQGEDSRGAPDDLQYACIFPLDPPTDCTTRSLQANEACDCYEGDNDRPLCEQDPGASAPGTTQYFAKAYPGTRHLAVLKDYGANSIVASICARNVSDQSRPDFGYRPAIAAIVDRLKEQLGDRCLPRSLITDLDGAVACNLVETIPQPEGQCNCNPAIARQPPDPQVDAVVRGQLAIDPIQPCGSADPTCSRACLCEVLQVQQVPGAAPNALDICRNDEDATGVEGWCYIDEDQMIGNPALVENCPATERRLLRFVGAGLQPNTTTFVACTGSSFQAQE
jgi:hypothetical protein